MRNLFASSLDLRDGVKSLLIKLGLTAAMLAFILAQVDVGASLDRFGDLPLIAVVAGLLIAMAQIAMLAWRWMLVSRLTAVRASFPRLLRFTMVSPFFSQGLPVSVGGDALRVWCLTRTGVATGRAVHNVALDRLAGFLSLLLVNLLALPLLAWRLRNPPVEIGISATVALAFLLVVLAASRLGRRLTIAAFALLQRLSRRPRRGRAVLRWRLTLQRASAQLLRPRRGGPAMLWGAAIHLASVLLAFLLASQAGIAVPLLGLCAVVPVVLLLSYLPITIGGWGVREGGMAVALGLIGVPTSDAVFIGLALGAFGLATALLGAVVWLGQPIRFAPVR
jgi:uncharacterized protein (TIRG00374 family)